MRKRDIDRITRAAQDAFWAVVAEECPDIKTGDLDPMATMRFHDACLQAVESWIEANQCRS